MPDHRDEDDVLLGRLVKERNIIAWKLADLTKEIGDLEDKIIKKRREKINLLKTALKQP